MKYLQFAWLGAWAFAATAAVAAPVTYTIKGNLDSTHYLQGPAATALSAAMGTPATYEAQFTFDPAQAQMGNVLFVNGIAAKLWVDGHSLGDFTPQFPNQSIVSLGSSGGINDGFLDFQTQKTGDLFSSIPGGFETISFEVKIYGTGDTLPANGSFPTTNFTFVNSAVALRYSKFDISGPMPQSSLAERGTYGFSDAITSLDISPAPEPSEWAMIGLGLAIVAQAVRRRR